MKDESPTRSTDNNPQSDSPALNPPGFDLEELARKEQQATDRYEDGNRDLQAIAKKVGLGIREVREALVGHGLTTWEGDDLLLPVSEISARDVDDTYLFDAEILSIEGGMTLPTRIQVKCLRCEVAGSHGNPTGTEMKATKTKLTWSDLLPLAPAEKEQLVESAAYVAHEGDSENCKRTNTKVKWTEIEDLDYSILTVTDIRKESRFGQIRDDLRIDVHLVGPRPPLGGRVRLRGKVQVHPRTRRLWLLSEEFKELEGRPAAPEMSQETQDAFTRIGKLPNETLRNQVAPTMVGRPLAQEAGLLTQASVARVPDVAGDKEIRGALITAFLGDTTSNKTETARDAAEGLGPFIQAENARRTGLTHNVTERPWGGWKLSWGILPRYHGTLAVVDGLEQWTAVMVGELRSVLREGRVRVEKVVHGERPALLRYFLTLNPRKAMAEYPFRCEAIRDSWVFKEGPDVARVDVWITFGEDDVDKDAIAHREAATRPVEPKVWRSFVFWAWSLRPEDVAYMDPAKSAIQEVSARLMKDYGSSSVPVAHAGLRETVTRIAVAYAVLGYSTTDGGRKLVVQEEHVEAAEDFLLRVYDALELKEYRDHHDRGAILTGGEFLDVVGIVGASGREIVSHLARKTNGWTSAKELADLLGGDWDVHRIRHQYEDLVDLELLETRSGAGVRLTPQGVVFFRWTRDVNELFSQKSARSRGDDASSRKKVREQLSREGQPAEETGGGP